LKPHSARESALHDANPSEFRLQIQVAVVHYRAWRIARPATPEIGQAVTFLRRFNRNVAWAI